MISDYCLDNVSYNEKLENITWENSTIRQWLNETFINNAFTAEQRSSIIESRIENNDTEYGINGGNDTNDKLFLLSIEEVRKYFGNDKARIAYPTPYAKSKNSVNGKLWVSDKSCGWWLRSPGPDQMSATIVTIVGFVYSRGICVCFFDTAVRPAFWLDLKNL